MHSICLVPGLFMRETPLTYHCKVIATSGPSGTYPQRAYRNPLDTLVKFLDSKHKEHWAIWEFRAEGTGYPDEEVYGRVFHFPWPDHHPPPFMLIPNIIASMRNWLRAEDGRVVVVHCKAGKGRSGTASCSYLVSEEGWSLDDALKRFTERRMRPGFGNGVSIPSQLRWLTYVDRWARQGKLYVERRVEIVEVHMHGLRDGVKIAVEGFIDEGKIIKIFHQFTSDEQEVVRGTVGKNGGLAGVVAEVLRRKNDKRKAKKAASSRSSSRDGRRDTGLSSEPSSAYDSPVEDKDDSDTGGTPVTPSKTDSIDGDWADVIFRPKHRVILPTNDINIDFERRNKAAYGLTMVTAVAHVWFNAFFEGNGPENNGKAEDSGVFEIEWDKIDGIKGSSKKGSQAFDKVAVVWRELPDEPDHPHVLIQEPKEGEEVKQTKAADWKGVDTSAPDASKDLGIRASSPSSSVANFSSSPKEKEHPGIVTAPAMEGSHLEGVKSHGLDGEDLTRTPERVSTDLDSEPPIRKTQTEPDASEASQIESTNSPIMQSPASQSTPAVEAVGGKSHVSTGDLPDGWAETELKPIKEHGFGHLRRENNPKNSEASS